MTRQQRNAQITSMVEKGSTYQRAADKFGITRERVRQICIRDGIRSVRGFDPTAFYRYLSEDQVMTILNRFDRGMPISHIAEIVETSQSAVYSALRAHRNYTPTRTQDAWSDAEIAFLRKHYKKPGWSASAIGLKLGRTRDECIGKANRLGLRDVGFSQRQQTQIHTRRVAIKTLRSKGLTYAKIAEKLNLSMDIVAVDCHRIKQEAA